MSTPGDTREDLQLQIEELRARAEEAEAVLAAVRAGEVDAFVVGGPGGEQVFTLHGADEPYRLAIEQMNAGTATVTRDGVVLYCNNRLAAMVHRTPEQVVGGAFEALLAPYQAPAWQRLLAQGRQAPCSGEVAAFDGVPVPWQLSLSPMSAGGAAAVCLVAVDLTEIKEREEQLLRSEAMRDTAERVGQAGSWTFDLVTREATWSPGMYELFDLDPPDGGAWGRLGSELALLEAVRTRVHPDDRALFDVIAEPVESGTAVGPWDFRVVRRDGSVTHLHLYGRIESDAAGAPVRIVGHVRDVTDRALTELALRHDEARMRALVDGTPLVLFQVDRDHHTTGNERFHELVRSLLGRGLDEGEPLRLDEIPPRVRDAWHDLRGRALSGEAFTEELSLDVGTGPLTWELSFTPVTVDGETVGAVVTAQDVTERREADRALREMEAMRDLAEATGRIMSFTLDLKSGAMTWSPGVHAIYDLDEGDVATDLSGPLEPAVAEAVLAHIVPEEREAIRAHIARTARTGDYRSTDFHIRHRDGSIHTVHSDGQVYFDDEGRPERVVGYHQDVTEQRRAEAEVRALNADLERRVQERTAELEEAAVRLADANRELESFSYSVSHDLRAPLRAIDGFSEILAEDYAAALDEDGLGHLARIRDGAQRMGRLIDDLLELSRVSRREIERDEVELSAAAARILAELAAAAPERRVAASVQPGCRAVADHGLVAILLTNLLGNAWKFTAQQDVACIAVGARTEGDETVFFVRDDGIGFDQEHAGRLFAPFHRLHGDEAFPGSGIGLAIVQRVVVRHGGRVWAEAAPGEGATFFFTLGTPAGEA